VSIPNLSLNYYKNDDKIFPSFKCDQETADVVLELRGNLEKLLLKKALYPAPIEDNGYEKQLIK